MIRFKKSCKVCAAVKGNSKLLNEIYNSNFFLKNSAVSLMSIWKEHQGEFSYDGLKNHVKKHQFLSQEDFSERHLRKIAKDAEKAILKRTIDSKEVWDEVINVGVEKLQKGEMPVSTANLLQAARDKSNFQLRQQDQQLAMIEMVYHFASGEDQESRAYDRRLVRGEAVADYDVAGRTTENIESGADGPGAVHYPPAWDATA